MATTPTPASFHWTSRRFLLFIANVNDLRFDAVFYSHVIQKEIIYNYEGKSVLLQCAANSSHIQFSFCNNKACKKKKTNKKVFLCAQCKYVRESRNSSTR
jgi:hypothetical protein